jgi:hypothetical protein
MVNVTWLEVAPPVMSAIAAVCATIAAFGSSRVSREAKKLSEQSALATHHRSAAETLTDAAEMLQAGLELFRKHADDVSLRWSSEIGKYNHRDLGGTDPRPLRHVVANASEMLVAHGSENGKNWRSARRRMYSIISNGVGEFSEAEYRCLLDRADKTYFDFESTLGPPSQLKPITGSSAFRWTMYQLTRRVSADEWRKIWRQAWAANGRLSKFRAEHEAIKPLLNSSILSLKSERAKLKHSVFPLEANPSLLAKYKKIETTLEVLLEDCDLDLWDTRQIPTKKT